MEAGDETFAAYLDLDKERLRKMLDETQIKLEQLAHVLDLDPNDDEVAKEYNLEEERYHWIKLALVASDDCAMLSTVDLAECGSTLDVNRGLGGGKFAFKINLKKKEAPKDAPVKEAPREAPLKEAPKEAPLREEKLAKSNFPKKGGLPTKKEVPKKSEAKRRFK